LFRLAELREERKRRARDRFKVVAADWEDRADLIRHVAAEVDEEIRQTTALIARLQAKRHQRRAASPRSAVRHVLQLDGVSFYARPLRCASGRETSFRELSRGGSDDSCQKRFREQRGNQGGGLLGCAAAAPSPDL